MKYDIHNLFFAKCRWPIMDMINIDGPDEGFIHPDYMDYYTIIFFRNNEYINLFNKKEKYKHVSEVEDSEKYHAFHLILELHSLSDYIDTEHKKVSEKECDLIEGTIEKTLKLVPKYGYKK